MVGILVSYGLARNLYSIYQNSKYIDNARQKIEQLRAENEQLQAENNAARQPGFIEQQAREMLGLVKPGEVVLIIPPQVTSPSSEATSAGGAKEQPRYIWQQWINLFFGA